jgi:predicted KAP-like P-loop ATPase
MSISNDSPISEPEEDLYGLDPFSHAIARSIEDLDAPEGVVFAINGEWGSGKSSAVNLILYHLRGALERGNLSAIRFNPWWFAGSDTLALAFFRELSVALGPSISKQVRKSLRTMGQGVSSVGPLVGAAVNLKAPGLGSLLQSGIGLAGGLLKRGEKTIEQEHAEISGALRRQPKRFLVVIDDLDRLAPDDALTMFRLVKSVGRLPNVIYLLAFDRTMAERAIVERFPSEGSAFLEKIIQSSFDVPPPLTDALWQRVLGGSYELMGQPPEAQSLRFMNMFYDIVARCIRTPRHAIRLLNDLSATWPAVSRNVDRSDFLALAALRQAHPAVYRGIREHPNDLCGIQMRIPGIRSEDQSREYDQILGLGNMEAATHEVWRRALRRILPRLDSVWGNVFRDREDVSWERDRRLCSRAHFDTYFAFAVSEDVVPADEIAALVARAGDRAFVEERFRDNLRRRRRTGATRASLLLEELTVHAAEVARADVEPLTVSLFALGDELDVEADEARGFAARDNSLRLHWLFNMLVTDRFAECEREAVYGAGMTVAPVGWACDFASRCMRAFVRYDERELGARIVGEEAARGYSAQALTKLRAAADDGSLVDHPRFAYLLFEWARISEEGDAGVRRWTDERLANNHFVVMMAKAMCAIGWSQGMGWDGGGDLVARRTIHVNTQIYRDILDVERMDSRVGELIATPTTSDDDRAVLVRYRDAPRRARGEPD